MEPVDSDQLAKWDRVDKHWALTRDGELVAWVYEIPEYAAWTCKFKHGNLLVEVPTRHDAMMLAEVWTHIRRHGW